MATKRRDLDREPASKSLSYAIRKKMDGKRKVVARITVWPHIDGITAALGVPQGGAVLVESHEDGTIGMFLDLDDECDGRL